MGHVREMNRTLARLQQKLQEASPDFHVSSGDSTSAPATSKIQELADRASVLDRQIISLAASAEPERAAMWTQLSQ